jgi:hypothetical protein
MWLDKSFYFSRFLKMDLKTFNDAPLEVKVYQKQGNLTRASYFVAVDGDEDCDFVQVFSNYLFQV